MSVLSLQLEDMFLHVNCECWLGELLSASKCRTLVHKTVSELFPSRLREEFCFLTDSYMSLAGSATPRGQKMSTM